VLSPRSTEINSIISKIKDSFKKKNDAPVTDISFYRVGKMLGSNQKLIFLNYKDW